MTRMRRQSGVMTGNIVVGRGGGVSLSSSASFAPPAPGSATSFVGTGADDAAVGSATWSNPSNITSDNGTAATVLIEEGTSHYLKGTNCGFAIPDGATIDGVTVVIKRKLALGSGITGDSVVRLVKGGVISGDDYAELGVAWPTSYAVATYGGATDLWGLSLTAADVNSADFGVVLSVASNDADTANVDYISITINYTA